MDSKQSSFLVSKDSAVCTICIVFTSHLPKLSIALLIFKEQIVQRSSTVWSWFIVKKKNMRDYDPTFWLFKTRRHSVTWPTEGSVIYKMVSSAYRWIVWFLISSPNLFIRIVKRNGPRLEPCGTPLWTHKLVARQSKSDRRMDNNRQKQTTSIRLIPWDDIKPGMCVVYSCSCLQCSCVFQVSLKWCHRQWTIIAEGWEPTTRYRSAAFFSVRVRLCSIQKPITSLPWKWTGTTLQTAPGRLRCSVVWRSKEPLVHVQNERGGRSKRNINLNSLFAALLLSSWIRRVGL